MSKSPKRKMSKSPKRKMSKSPKRKVSKKPVAAAMMDGMEQKPEVVSMMAPLPSPGMIVGAAVADTVTVMTPKKASRSKSPKRATRSKSPKKSPKRKASKSPKRAASPRKVKVLAFGMMPSESKPMSPRRMSKAKSK
jgi:hypothetical protein